jgi:hypothetical protein
MNFLHGLLFILNSESLGQMVGVISIIAAGIPVCFFLWRALLWVCGRLMERPVSKFENEIDPRHFDGPERRPF